MDRHQLLATYRSVDEDGAMQRRVRLALLRTRSRPTMWGARVLRPALAFAALALMTSLAAAWAIRSVRAYHLAAHAAPSVREISVPHLSVTRDALIVAEPSAARPTSAAATHRAVTHKHLGRTMETSAPSEPTLPIDPPATSSAPIATDDAPVLMPAETPVPMPAAPSSAESRLIMDGLSALRIAHDTDHAQRSFARYLDLYPHGALVEEALAYEIEAAAARGSNAGALAAEYLRRFPRGRFRVAAGNAQKRFAH